MKESQEKTAINARVVLAKCPKNGKVYGMRIQEEDGDWLRTWAFKIDEERARHEGYDSEISRGTMTPTPEYPGCPYCGGFSLARCSCGKVFCWTGKSDEAVCPWCGMRGKFIQTDKINVQGGGM